MPRGLSIRLRLAAWYFVSVAMVLGMSAAGSYLVMRAALTHAIDEGLRYDIRGVQEFLASHGGSDPTRLREELNRRSSLMLGGGLFQLFDQDGNLIYQSPGLARHDIPAVAPGVRGEAIAYRNAGPRGWPLRVAAQRLDIDGRPHVIEVAEPLRSFRAALRDYGRTLLLLTPLLVVAAGGVGYWISGRALAPVDRIIQDARAIDPRKLSARLSVPPARDELRHLTETLNAMLDRIELAFARIAQFTADASHELRAPLALVQAAAEHSLRRERSREELVESMRKVMRESERMAHLIDELLLLARADSSEAEARTAPTDLTALLQEVADRGRTLAAAKGIDFVPEIMDTPVRVLGDADRLHRLAMILIDNAVKYTPANGQVKLLLRSTHESACVEVVDTGAGIAEEDLPKIFDRFWRADRVRSRGIGGTGLGLSIARWIADSSGGTLAVESRLGRGSTFRVTLPLFPG